MEAESIDPCFQKKVEGEILERCEIGWIRILQRRFVSTSLAPPISRYDTQSEYSGWDIHDTVYSRELLISNRENGYRDLIAKIDLSTFRRIPWEKNVPFFLVSFFDPDTKKPLFIDPRNVLKKVVDIGNDLGYLCYSGIEYEVC